MQPRVDDLEGISLTYFEGCGFGPDQYKSSNPHSKAVYEDFSA